jgi:uncharacterized repeat protein (TIGR02543 family)
MAITWGNIIQGTKDSRQGKIGIETTVTTYDTSVTVKVNVYFASKYALNDTNNTWYYNEGTSATTSKGKKDIVHTYNTGSGWNSTNVTLLGTFTHTYGKTTTAQTKYFSAKITGLDNLGSSNVSSVKVSISVPALAIFTVTYNANGGTGAPSSQTLYYGQSITISSTVPTRTGYTFQGWATTSTGSASYWGGSSFTTKANATLYAVWKINTYTVTYNANGGTGAPANQTKTYGVNLTLSATIPTRANYNFKGWATYSSATTPTYSAGGTYTGNVGVTLYAVWEIAYVKPRITNVSVVRCDSDGTVNESGQYAKISFKWAVDETSPKYAVYYKKTTDSAYSGGTQVALSGTSGTVSAVVVDASGNHVFDTEFAFDIQLNVADSKGHTPTFTTLNAVFIPIDCTDDGDCMSFGEPAKDSESGVLRFAYDVVDLAPKISLKYKGEDFFGGKVIWSGSSVFNATHSITLSKKVSEMKSGLLLLFARDGDYNFTPLFIPKYMVAHIGRIHCTIPMVTSLYDYVGSKTVYVSDTKIEGFADNDKTGKNAISGITYHNEAFYLRYVYEV